MSDDLKISQDEMIEMFGEAMPVEAVNLLWNAAEGTTLGELRSQLREIAAHRIEASRPERDEVAAAIFDVIWPTQEWNGEETLCRAVAESAAKAAIAAIKA